MALALQEKHKNKTKKKQNQSNHKKNKPEHIRKPKTKNKELNLKLTWQLGDFRPFDRFIPRGVCQGHSSWEPAGQGILDEALDCWNFVAFPHPRSPLMPFWQVPFFSKALMAETVWHVFSLITGEMHQRVFWSLACFAFLWAGRKTRVSL